MPCDHFEPDKGLHSGKCARCGAWTTSFERFSRVTTLFGKSHAEVTTAQAVELDSDICLACFETCACFSPQNQIAYPSLRSDSGPTAGSCATVAVIGSDSACFEDCAARSLDMTSQISSSSSRTRGTTRNPAPSSLFRPQQGPPCSQTLSGPLTKNWCHSHSFPVRGETHSDGLLPCSKADARPVLCTMQARPGRARKQQVLSRQSLQVRVCSFPALLSRCA